ncbi:MAG: hypothetical protein QXK88_02970 [Desulfurococcaceae archaeon]
MGFPYLNFMPFEELFDETWRYMSIDGFEPLKTYLHEYLSKKIPGMLNFLNMLCNVMHRSDCISLLLVSPSKLYLTILSHYRGDMLSADYAFTLVFLSPISAYFKKPELVQQLLEFVKTGRDSDFADLIKKSLKDSLPG